MTTRRLLALAAALLGVLALFAGSPYRSARATVDVDRLAAAVAAEKDHVTAIELAQWIRARKRGLRIIDLRSPADFDAYHLRQSESVPIEALSRASFGPDDTIVLISEGGGHAAQGWVFLEALGYQHVFFLRGGIDEWNDEVLHPQLPIDATPAERAAFEAVAPLSRYFGGVPRSGTSRAERAPGHVEGATRLRRGGC